ncbi:acetoacetate-CoA ligase [Pseudomonas fluorescens]|uniref:Acetoacetate-CoA ligase n=1 Tax=Pseudomonas fluorescens TaxID=294 RepID=A0A0P8ZWP3_PSEFL|nr:acetoacetate--CoA ligase [Pseudomonas fluorescens]KPU62126.1 acetoacetate-CoA ligase [Pseudomonas fluorescens]
MVSEGKLLWMPNAKFATASNISKYIVWLRAARGLSFSDYEQLRQWSVTNLEDFWASIWEYFSVHSITPYQRVLDQRVMPGAKWFEGARVNYAEHLLRHEQVAAEDEVVFHHLSEIRSLASMTWKDVGRQVRIVATQLRQMGVQPGDCVVSYMPNVPETAIAMMATTAIGAIWSSAAPEFGVKTVLDRFAQIAPKVIFAVDGYRFAGKDFDKAADVQHIVQGLPSLQHVVWLPYLKPEAVPPALPGLISWPQLLNHLEVSPAEFQFEYVEHDHPLWILFSSGTTGLPKAIVHSHVGILVEHLKMTHFHLNLKDGSAMFFYSTTGWMVWNALISVLLAGSAAVLYDGSPVYPQPDMLWKLAADTGATVFGASPTFVQIMEKAGLKPGELFDLSRLECVVLSGAPSPPETFDWFYRSVKRDLWVTSQSGGTELCSTLVGAVPMLPVYAGEMQARLLGMDVRVWSDDGLEVDNEVGELVVTNPIPSMPLRFLHDEGGKRYHESYFDVFPGVWRHGDFLKINERGGCFIYGRSDSTLNRHGVRIGTAEIYRVVEQIEEVADCLIVCCERPGGNFFMPLFVKLKANGTLDEKLVKKINQRLQQECSPRHVPDRIVEVAAVPYTLTGKKMEVPVRKLFMGWPLEKAASRDTMLNPDAIEIYIELAETLGA